METRDLVESAAGGPISTAEEGLAVLRRVAPEGNWSVERVEQSGTSSLATNGSFEATIRLSLLRLW